MKITDVRIHSAKVTAEVELDSGEVAKLGMSIDQAALTELAQSKLAGPTVEASPISYLTEAEAAELADSGYVGEPGSFTDVVDENSAQLEAEKAARDRADAARADQAWSDHKDRI